MNFRNLILVLALVLLSVFAAGERVTQRFGECASCDVKGVASDSIVKSTQPALNFGSDATIYYRSLSPSLEARALMRFDLNSIPSGARVYSAKLRFFSNTDSLTDKPEGKIGIKQPIYALTDSSGTGVWVESQATFNNKAAQIPWSSQGDITTAIGSQAGFVYFKNWVAGSQAYYDVELAGIVQSWVNLPSSNLGLYIPTGPYYNKSFISKENPRADLRPYLEVAFEGTNSESIPLPSDIQAKFHNGQTFITWKEAVTDKNETSYRIYRYTQPIISSNINTAELLDQVYQGSSYFTDMTLNGIGGTTIKQPDLSPA
ncbi:MAG: DNRLRE domain-containing protein, partial [Candidatus Diapherotrites archaeon]|nr:DNRLRE domain-containing protein [Candidatus Diapherotrites archaeon]